MEKTIRHLNFLKNIEKYDQRSKEWLEQRKNKLTSSDAATALGINPYKKPIELLLEKCGAESSFEGNESTLHGQKYEDEAISKYEMLMSKVNHTFGMISFSDLDPIRKENGYEKYIDKKYHFLGGSPDGISIDKIVTHDSVLSQVEVKCPLRRKIKHGQVPEYYYPQIQLNMFILDLEVTDFIEYIPNGLSGKKLEFNLVRIYRDEDWFDKNFIILQNFWKEVEYWRTQDIKTHPEYNKYYKIKNKITPIYLFIDDQEDKDNQNNTYIENKCMFEDD